MALNTGRLHLNIMQTNLDIYTSTGKKYARHPEMFNALRNGIGRPESLQVSLTNKCNLSCIFCSVAERELKQQWDYYDLCKSIQKFMIVGIKTVEFSGGGEPTLHPEFNAITHFAKGLGLRLGLITNGLRLKYISEHVLKCYDWIRISMVALDYQETIELPDKFPENVTIGMSYVVGQKEYQGKRTYWKSDLEQLMKIKKYAEKYNVKFIRIVPECFSDENEMNQIHECYQNLCDTLGQPFMFQPKRQKQAEHCWMDSLKPWLHVDGYVYPCNSISLNTDANRDFAPQYRLCHWTEIESYYNNRGNQSLDVSRCDRCTFFSNNKIISELLKPMEMEEFV